MKIIIAYKKNNIELLDANNISYDIISDENYANIAWHNVDKMSKEQIISKIELLHRLQLT